MSEYIYETHGEQVIGNPKGFIFPKGEIVRCRDCMFYEEEGFCSWFECSYCSECQRVEPDGYCAWGVKRKEDGE